MSALDPILGAFVPQLWFGEISLSLLSRSHYVVIVFHFIIIRIDGVLMLFKVLSCLLRC